MHAHPRHLRMHGLVVHSEIPLHHGRGTDAPADFTVTEGDSRRCPDDAPEGELLAELSRPDGGPFYTLVRTPDGYLLRCHQLCDIEINAGLDEAVCHPDPDGVPEILPVIVAGTLIAMVLCLRAELVLHASAVDLDSHAVAFVGESGMGKSTLATWLCGAGGRLITDDVLRVEPGDPTLCWLGATESRLRPAAVSLTERFDGSDTRQTADERTALTLPLATLEPISLSAVLVPQPDRTASTASVEWLAPADAMVLLSRYPRVLGWQSAQVLGEQFLRLGELVKRVRVGIATVPWGPPFDPDVPAQLVSALASPTGS